MLARFKQSAERDLNPRIMALQATPLGRSGIRGDVHNFSVTAGAPAQILPPSLAASLVSHDSGYKFSVP